MIDFSQILLRSTLENNAIESLMNSSSSESFIHNSNNEKIFKIKIPFHQCHETSAIVFVENNVLQVEAKLRRKDTNESPLENSSFQQQRLLPDNLELQKMNYYFIEKVLNVEIPVKTETKFNSERKREKDLIVNTKDRLDEKSLHNQSLKYSIENGKYVISEDLGICFNSPNISLKFENDAILHITVCENSSDGAQRKNLNLKREYRLRTNVYDLKNATATIVGNNILKIFVPIKTK